MRYINLLSVALLLSSCLGGEKKAATENSTESYSLAYVFEYNNTLDEYVKCSLTGASGQESIECNNTPYSIPPISTFTVYGDRGDDYWGNVLKSAADGCYENLPGNTFKSISLKEIDADTCDLKFQLLQPGGAFEFDWDGPTVSGYGDAFTHSLSFLNDFKLRVVNQVGEDCGLVSTDLNGKKKEFSFKEKEFSLSSLFSLQPSSSMQALSTVSNDQEFVFEFMPAIDVDDLKSGGLSDQEIESFLSSSLGDYVLLAIEGSNGKSFYCKTSDAVEGQIVIPTRVMQKLSGETTFYLSRYKLYEEEVTPGIKVYVNMKIGMHRTGNDLYGMNNLKIDVLD